MIKVKEMKKLIERVEEFPEYEILFDRYVYNSAAISREQELELKLDHQGNNIIVSIKE